MSKIRVHMAFDSREQRMWFVDSLEKLPRRIASLSLAKAMEFGNLKAMVYDTEHVKTDCVVDVDGWVYDSRRARGIERGLFEQQPGLIGRHPR